MNEKKFKQQYEVFLIKAKQDLNLVEQVINNPDVSSEIKFFHLQQGAEKALKALLCYKGIQFPKTHDIEDLIDLAEASSITLPAEVNVLSELTPYAVEFRYALMLEATKDVKDYLKYVKDFLGLVEGMTGVNPVANV